MDATQSALNALLAVICILMALSPLIILGLFVGALRKTNAKRRARERESQVEMFARVMAEARNAETPPFKRPTQDPARKPWYLR